VVSHCCVFCVGTLTVACVDLDLYVFRRKLFLPAYIIIPYGGISHLFTVHGHTHRSSNMGYECFGGAFWPSFMICDSGSVFTSIQNMEAVCPDRNVSTH
jgi:hypothetical protein